jgi:hypothetical protein
MISYLLFAVIWSTAFVLWSLEPIVAEAHQAAGKQLRERLGSAYLQTVLDVFLAFLAGGCIAISTWTDQALGLDWPAPALIACYLVMLIATIITLRPQARSRP